MKALVDLWTFATAWFNVPFTLALLAFLGLSALQFVGLEQDHDADADADVHVDLDHDVSVDHDLDMDHDLAVEHDMDVDHDLSLEHDAGIDHDLSAEHDAELDHDVDHDLAHEASTDAGGGAPAWAGALRFLGVGQAPVTMILLILLGSFGILGWIANASVLGIFPQYPALVLPAVLLFDVLLAGLVITPRLSGLVGRAVPAFSSTATSVKHLVSRRGHVISAQVDEQYGQVKLRDQGGTLITVFAVVDPGKPPIPHDTNVILVEYDEDKKRFVVVPSDL